MAEKGKTVGEWLVEQAKGEAGKARKVKLMMLDALGVLALLLRLALTGRCYRRLVEGCQLVGKLSAQRAEYQVGVL